MGIVRRTVYDFSTPPPVAAINIFFIKTQKKKEKDESFSYGTSVESGASAIDYHSKIAHLL